MNSLFPTVDPPATPVANQIRIVVYGIPRPGGSKRSMPVYRKGGKPLIVNGRVITNTIEAGKHTKEWRQDVAAAAREQYTGPILTGLLSVTMTFFMPRPNGHYGSGRNAGVLKASAPIAPGGTPDVLKLGRSTEDSLTSVVWRDDCLTVNLHLHKRYAEDGKPGAVIVIEPYTGK